LGGIDCYTTLQPFYTQRNQLELLDSQFLDKETVDKTSEISLRLFVVANGLPNVGAVQVGNLFSSL
jgi:hypothetical protein